MITLSRRNSIVSGSVAAGFSLVPGSLGMASLAWGFTLDGRSGDEESRGI